MGGSPPNLLVILVSHIAAGFAGFFWGNQASLPRAPHEIDQLAELAARKAVSRFQELGLASSGGGGDEPRPGSVAGAATSESSDRAVLTLRLGTPGLLISIVVIVFSLLLCVILCCYWGKWGSIRANEKSQSAAGGHRDLALQQLAELRLRKLNVAPKSPSSSSI